MNSEVINFSSVIKRLDKEGSAKGFRELRNFLLANHPSFKFIALKDILALVIACDKHAMFADIAAAKSNSKRDEHRWNLFQDYMNGKIEFFDKEEGNEEGNESLSISEGGEEDSDLGGDE